VYNLLDKTYYNALTSPTARQWAGPYYSQPGRTWKASMIVAF
jgi:hemoglobin/transferrin/lactoferrin receptor protein